MQRFYPILWPILAFLFSILVVGALGNLVYERFYKAPPPKLMLYLYKIWPWLLIAIVLTGGLTLWSWLDLRNKQLRANLLFAESENRRIGGQHDKARHSYLEALTLYKQLGNRQGQADTLRGLGDLERKLNRND
jgi:hypothetical protein